MTSSRHGYLKQSRKQFRSRDDGGCPWWNEPRPFSRWEAWQDMLQSAAYSPHTRMVGGTLVELERGETPPRSIRYLAKRWSRSEKWARGFLDMAREMGRLRAHQRTHEGHTYLVVNYKTYQGQGHSQGTDKDTQKGTAGARPGRSEEHSQGTKYKKGKKGKEGWKEGEEQDPPHPTRTATAGNDVDYLDTDAPATESEARDQPLRVRGEDGAPDIPSHHPVTHSRQRPRVPSPIPDDFAIALRRFREKWRQHPETHPGNPANHGKPHPRGGKIDAVSTALHLREWTRLQHETLDEPEPEQCFQLNPICPQCAAEWTPGAPLDYAMVCEIHQGQDPQAETEDQPSQRREETA